MRSHCIPGRAIDAGNDCMHCCPPTEHCRGIQSPDVGVARAPFPFDSCRQLRERYEQFTIVLADRAIVRVRVRSDELRVARRTFAPNRRVPGLE